MGSESGSSNEKPVHNVTLTAFRIGATPVTVSLWKEYCSASRTTLPIAPDWGLLDDHPVVNVSWNDIVGSDNKGGFCAWASDISGFRLTLPTESQFEYAARGGVDGQSFPWGNEYHDSKVWSSVNFARDKTAPVNRALNVHRNAFGLSDMAGNIWHWCNDFYGSYEPSAQTDPISRSSNSENFPCLRGGSWGYGNPDFFRCAKRFRLDPESRFSYIGFRLSAGLD
jgi:formylglycine-generating enzyme required for sulfatase activity